MDTPFHVTMNCFGLSAPHFFPPIAFEQIHQLLASKGGLEVLQLTSHDH